MIGALLSFFAVGLVTPEERYRNQLDRLFRRPLPCQQGTDGIGLLADSRMDLTYHIWEHRDYWIAAGIDALTILALDKDTYEGIKKDALDPYLFVRDAYAQHRQSKIDSIRNPDDAEQTTE